MKEEKRPEHQLLEPSQHSCKWTSICPKAFVEDKHPTNQTKYELQFLKRLAALQKPTSALTGTQVKPM